MTLAAALDRPGAYLVVREACTGTDAGRSPGVLCVFANGQDSELWEGGCSNTYEWKTLAIQVDRVYPICDNVTRADRGGGGEVCQTLVRRLRAKYGIAKTPDVDSWFAETLGTVPAPMTFAEALNRPGAYVFSDNDMHNHTAYGPGLLCVYADKSLSEIWVGGMSRRVPLSEVPDLGIRAVYRACDKVQPGDHPGDQQVVCGVPSQELTRDRVRALRAKYPVATAATTAAAAAAPVSTDPATPEWVTTFFAELNLPVPNRVDLRGAPKGAYLAACHKDGSWHGTCVVRDGDKSNWCHVGSSHWSPEYVACKGIDNPHGWLVRAGDVPLGEGASKEYLKKLVSPDMVIKAAATAVPVTAATPVWVVDIFQRIGESVPTPFMLKDAPPGTYLVDRPMDDTFSHWKGMHVVTSSGPEILEYVSATMSTKRTIARTSTGIATAIAWAVSPRNTELTEDESDAGMTERVKLIRGMALTKQGRNELTRLGLKRDDYGTPARVKDLGDFGVACDAKGNLIVRTAIDKAVASSGVEVAPDTWVWVLCRSRIRWGRDTAGRLDLAVKVAQDGIDGGIWQDLSTAETGPIAILCRHAYTGAIAAYVAVPKTHPWFNKRGPDIGVAGIMNTATAGPTYTDEDFLGRNCPSGWWLVGFDSGDQQVPGWDYSYSRSKYLTAAEAKTKLQTILAAARAAVAPAPSDHDFLASEYVKQISAWFASVTRDDGKPCLTAANVLHYIKHGAAPSAMSAYWFPESTYVTTKTGSYVRWAWGTFDGIIRSNAAKTSEEKRVACLQALSRSFTRTYKHPDITLWHGKLLAVSASPINSGPSSAPPLTDINYARQVVSAPGLPEWSTAYIVDAGDGRVLADERVWEREIVPYVVGYVIRELDRLQWRSAVIEDMQRRGLPTLVPASMPLVLSVESP